MNLTDFKGALPTIVKTRDIIADLETSKQTMSQLFQSVSKISDPAGGTLAGVDNNVLRNARSTQRNILMVLRSRSNQSAILNNIDSCITMLNGLPRSIPGRDASIRVASIIAVAELCNVLTTWTSSYLVELVKEQAAEVKDKEIYEPSVPTIRRLNKDASAYALALDYYTMPKSKLEEELNALPDLNVTKYNKGAIGRSSKQTVVDMITSNFIHNPIYHIRLYITEYQVWKYKLLRDEAQQLELLLISLQAEKAERPSAGVERELEQTEDRIARTRRSMASIAETEYHG